MYFIKLYFYKLLVFTLKLHTHTHTPAHIVFWSRPKAPITCAVLFFHYSWLSLGLQSTHSHSFQSQVGLTSSQTSYFSSHSLFQPFILYSTHETYCEKMLSKATWMSFLSSVGLKFHKETGKQDLFLIHTLGGCLGSGNQDGSPRGDKWNIPAQCR